MMGCKIKHKTREGFSLLEIIIAVGLLSLVSVYTLQIFVTAHRLNQQTIDKDESIQIANTVIQLVDGLSFNEMTLHPFFDQARFLVNGETLEIQQWYNENWKPVEGEQSDEQPDENQTFSHTVLISIEPHHLDELWHVNVRINRTEPYLLRQEKHTALYHLSVLRYLPDWEVNSQ